MLEVGFNREPVAGSLHNNAIHARTARLRRTRFVLVNDRKFGGADCALCGSKIKKMFANGERACSIAIRSALQGTLSAPSN